VQYELDQPDTSTSDNSVGDTESRRYRFKVESDQLVLYKTLICELCLSDLTYNIVTENQSERKAVAYSSCHKVTFTLSRTTTLRHADCSATSREALQKECHVTSVLAKPKNWVGRATISVLYAVHNVVGSYR